MRCMSKKRRMIFLLNQARHVLMNRLDAESRDIMGVSAIQLTALFYLSRQDGCLMKELASALLLDNSAITGLVSRMEKAGLVAKKRCSEDGRAFRVYMTAKGQQSVVQGMPMLAQVTSTMDDDFSEQELQVVERYLSALVSKFSK